MNQPVRRAGEGLQRALERTDGNKTGVARLVGLSRDTLRYLLEKYGIQGSR